MKKIALAVLLSAIAAPSFAAVDDTHMYVGVRVGQAKSNIEPGTFNNSTQSSSNPSGWGLLIGHSFNSSFAAEAEYLNLGEIKSGTNSAESTGFSLSGVGTFPINESFSMFGKVGYAMITGKPGGSYTGADAESDAFTYGVGVQANLSPAVSMRLGWDKYKFNDSSLSGNASFTSIGALVKF